jgi:hypothetical protein
MMKCILSSALLTNKFIGIAGHSFCMAAIIGDIEQQSIARVNDGFRRKNYLYAGKLLR